MEPFLTFKFLHIVSMFFAVGLALSGEIVVRRVAGTGDANAIHTTVTRTKAISGPISGALFMAGLLFGIVAALTGQIDLLRPWLVASYLAFAAAFALGLGVIDPWVVRLEQASAATAGGSEPEVLQRVIAEPRARAAAWALQGIVALIVFLMVVKPLG